MRHKTHHMQKRDLVVAFDFEAAGGVPSVNAFTQLGAVVMDLRTSEVLGTFNEYANMKDYKWEDRCVSEFWSKYPERYAETLAETEKAALTPKQVVDKFYDWARETCAGHNAYLLTDCAIFDAGLLRSFSSRDINYVFGSCNFVMDTCSFYNGLARAEPTYESFDGSSKDHALRALGLSEWPKFPVAHDHHPVNDAMAMAFKFVFVSNKLREAAEKQTLDADAMRDRSVEPQ